MSRSIDKMMPVKSVEIQSHYVDMTGKFGQGGSKRNNLEKRVGYSIPCVDRVYPARKRRKGNATGSDMSSIYHSFDIVTPIPAL
ncbi:hypothetical protein TNCV_1151891 [Trichonephila clavipes]|nr:hypothetical protein TNCV_1151891 [Trichonephila clavipes]